MTVIRASVFPPGIVAAFSTRNGGVSPPPLGMNLSFRVGDDPVNVRKNREIFFGGLGIHLAQLAIPGQVHGTNVQHVEGPGEYPETDALISSGRGLFLCVSVADCVPVLLFDPLHNAVAAVHAGWRGRRPPLLWQRSKQCVPNSGRSPPDSSHQSGRRLPTVVTGWERTFPPVSPLSLFGKRRVSLSWTSRG